MDAIEKRLSALEDWLTGEPETTSSAYVYREVVAALTELRALRELDIVRGEPVAWRPFYIDHHGNEVWAGTAFADEWKAREWMDRFADLNPTLVPLYALPEPEDDA